MRLVDRTLATRLALATGALALAHAAFAEGPVMASLQRAAAAGPGLGASLEAHSVTAGAPFAGNLGAGTVSGAPSGAPRAQSLNAGGLQRSDRLSKVPPPRSDREEKTLKVVRAAGAGAALVGVGLFAYALAAASSGPIGWAAALVFFGGLSAYLAHRRLKGHDDFR